MNYPIEKVRKDSLNVLEDQTQVFNDSPCREGKEGQFIFFGNETIFIIFQFTFAVTERFVYCILAVSCFITFPCWHYSCQWETEIRKQYVFVFENM